MSLKVQTLLTTYRAFLDGGRIPPTVHDLRCGVLYSLPLREVFFPSGARAPFVGWGRVGTLFVGWLRGDKRKSADDDTGTETVSVVSSSSPGLDTVRETQKLPLTTDVQDRAGPSLPRLRSGPVLKTTVKIVVFLVGLTARPTVVSLDVHTSSIHSFGRDESRGRDVLGRGWGPSVSRRRSVLGRGDRGVDKSKLRGQPHRSVGVKKYCGGGV